MSTWVQERVTLQGGEGDNAREKGGDEKSQGRKEILLIHPLERIARRVSQKG